MNRPASDAGEIAARLDRVRQRVTLAAARAGRPPGSIRLVIATKTQSPEAIRAAWLAGGREFGENYVQEAVRKRAALGDLAGLRWHLIGHLQTNKAKAAARCFDMVQTLDSKRVADALARARPSPMPVLIEVNVGGEASKSGVQPGDAEGLIEAVRGKTEVLGLMTIPPASGPVEDSRRYFGALVRLRNTLAAASGLPLGELSMGMTDDFEIAIEEGATIVRIGRAIFGERESK